MSMTAQEIFDKVVAHLREQKVPAFDQARDMCLYRMPDGKKCAVGCLLIDEEYSTQMEEGYPVGQLLDKWPSVAERLGRENRFLLRDLQKIHDDQLSQDWERQWEYLAASNELTYTPPLSALPQEDRNDPPV
jgi:hypothetical protein